MRIKLRPVISEQIILQKGSEGAIPPTTKVTGILAPLNEMAKVDLTEDEVYSRLRSVSNSKGNGIYDALRSADIHWDFSSPFTLLRVVRTEAELTPLVFTGDAETVNFMKEVAEVEEGKRCDCCGQLITTPLWNMPYGSLCDECSKRLDEQVHGKYETPWQKVEQGREERSTPWWFDL